MVVYYQSLKKSVSSFILQYFVCKSGLGMNKTHTFQGYYQKKTETKKTHPSQHCQMKVKLFCDLCHGKSQDYPKTSVYQHI